MPRRRVNWKMIGALTPSNNLEGGMLDNAINIMWVRVPWREWKFEMRRRRPNPHSVGKFFPWKLRIGPLLILGRMESERGAQYRVWPQVNL